MACGDYTQYAPVLRVYKYNTGEGNPYVPLPSPVCFYTMVESNGIFEQKTLFNGASIPCFFGNIISASVTQERLNHAVSFDIDFPYEYDTVTDNNFFTREVYALIPEVVTTDGGKKIVLPKDFNQSYLYRLDILKNGVVALDALLVTYYGDSSQDNLDAINTYINSNSKAGYWGYLVEPIIDRKVSSSMQFKFVGENYKLQTNMNLSYPEKTMYDFLVDSDTNDSMKFFKSVVKKAVNKNVYLPVYDGWSISAVILSVLYYSGLFPLGTNFVDLDGYSIIKEDYNSIYKRYKIKYPIDTNTNTAVVLVIETSLDDKKIPCSAIYPEYNDILQGGFSYQTNPFSMVQDILDELSEIVGFTYYFDNSLTANSGALVVEVNDNSADTVNITPFALTGENTFEANVVTTGEDVRNSITVIGQGIGLANSVVSEVEEEDDSIALFGKKQLVIESPLVLTSTQASLIAQNILDDYAYNAGNITVSMPIALDSNEIMINRELTFNANISSSRDLNGVEGLYVSNIDYIVSRREQGEMTIEATPLLDRTIVEIPGGFDNLSIVNDAEVFNKETAHFTYTTSNVGNVVGIDDAQIQDLHTDSVSFSEMDVEGLVTSKQDIFEYAEDITRTLYNYADVGDVTYTLTFYEETTVLQTYTINKSLGDSPTNVKIYAVGHGRCTGFREQGVCEDGMELQDLTFYIKVGDGDAEQIGNTYSDSNIGRATFVDYYFAKVESSGGTSHLVDMNFKYLDYDIGQDPVFALTFKLLPQLNVEVYETVEYPGLVEVGFLMIASSTVGEDSDGIPFNGMSVSDYVLSVNDEFIPDHSIGNIVTTIYNNIDNGFMINSDGSLETYGCLDNIVTVSYDEAISSLKSSIYTAYVPFSDANTEEGASYSSLLFRPLIQTDSVSLTYANVMCVVPVIKVTVNDVVRLYPQTDIFVLHGKLPEDYTDRFVLNNEVTHKLISSTGDIVTTNGSIDVQYYETQATIDTKGNTLQNLNLNDVNSTINFSYRCSYPVNMRLGIGNQIYKAGSSVPLYYIDGSRFKDTKWYGGNFARNSEFYFNIGLNKHTDTGTFKSREINVLKSFPEMIEFGYNEFISNTSWWGGSTLYPKNGSYADKIPISVLVDPFYALSLGTLIDKDLGEYVKYYGVYGASSTGNNIQPATYANNVFLTKDNAIYTIEQGSIPYWFCLDYLDPTNIPE